MNFKYILFDTINYDIEKSDIIHKNLMLTAGFIALKTAFDKNDIESVEKVFENLYKEGVLADIKRIEIFLVYILKTKDIDESRIIEIINNYDREGGRVMLTLESFFMEKGFEKGK